ncbi:mutator type transposase [Tanacetum coccineum]
MFQFELADPDLGLVLITSIAIMIVGGCLDPVWDVARSSCGELDVVEVESIGCLDRRRISSVVTMVTISSIDPWTMPSSGKKSDNVINLGEVGVWRLLAEAGLVLINLFRSEEVKGRKIHDLSMESAFTTKVRAGWVVLDIEFVNGRVIDSTVKSKVRFDDLEKDPGLFSLKIYHAGKFKYVDDKRKYVNGLVAYVDWCDIDKFSVHEIHGVMEKLGYVNDDPIYYHYLIPGTNLDMGLRALGNDLDVRGLGREGDNKFLECVGDDLGMTKDSNFTFISDRQKGLAIAMANVFPCAEHRSCLRHIHENMKKQWNGQAYKELLWRCASVTTVPYFDKAMQDLKDFNKECFEWLAKIPPHSWSRSHFSGRAKSDILLNNLCECFNGKILDARDAPIITALEYIREYLMRRMVNVIAVIKKTDGPLTPSATKLLKIAMDRANNCTVAFNGGEEYEVKGQSGSQCVVNVVKKVCSCRKWELTGIPCSHAIAANYNMSLNGVQVGIPEEWVDKCYWLATWQKTYSYTIGCLNGRVMWKKSQIPTTLTPPKHNTPVGRPRKNRRKSKEEKAEMVKDGKLSRAYKTVTCMKCGNLGHNSRCETPLHPKDKLTPVALASLVLVYNR